jgi:TRAP-type mannitol/chloroaromatic compound transport system permease small subunit
VDFLLSFSRLIDALNEAVGRLVSWLTLFMVVIGVYNAVTRKLSQTIGVDLSSNTYIELQWYMFALVFMWGAAYTLKHNAHVRVDIIYARLSERGKAWVDVLGTLLFLLPFTAVVLWTAWPIVLESWKIHEMSPDPGGLPRYPIKAALIVAFVLLFLQGLSELIKRVALLTGHQVALASGSEEEPSL